MLNTTTMPAQRLATSSTHTLPALARSRLPLAQPLHLCRGFRDPKSAGGPGVAAKKSIEEIMARANDALNPEAMFCYQCEQTLNGSGCTSVGVCGKSPEVAGLQDLLVYSLKGLSCLAHSARKAGHEDAEVNTFVNGALFSTLTNVNFDDTRFFEFIEQSVALHKKLATDMKAKGIPIPKMECPSWFGTMPQPLEWNESQANGFTVTRPAMIDLAKETAITVRRPALGKTLTGLQELIVYGLKGLCAYAHHAEALGKRDQRVYAFVQEALTFLCTKDCEDVGTVLAMALRTGETNFLVMEMLDSAHTSQFGHPVPTPVPLHPVPGPAILVTGHDMHDMDLLLQQTAGTGVNVYTHGEMLPAHGYPGLKNKYPHLVGHYGGAWYRQKVDFAHFPGAVLVTTNCVLEPLQSYRSNIFTLNEVGVSGVAHINGFGGPTGGKDFSKVIARAKELGGFTQAQCDAWPEKKVVTVGYAHNSVMNAAPKVVEAIQQGQLKHIFLIGGCDGSEPQRKYYTGLSKFMPEETMVLTLGCGKFRIFDQDWGTLPGSGLPRLLDMGQCNDAYSALVVATELAKALKTDINSLPLSLDISWFEQKAVAVLLTLLHLGVRNIRLGPRLPAFLTPEAIQVLVDKFNLAPADVAHPEEDMKLMMANK